MKWPKGDTVVTTKSAGQALLRKSEPWADDHPVVRERPDLFNDEPAEGARAFEQRPVEDARNVPGAGGRITGVKRTR
jgi:hypothetical protein